MGCTQTIQLPFLMKTCVNESKSFFINEPFFLKTHSPGGTEQQKRLINRKKVPHLTYPSESSLLINRKKKINEKTKKISLKSRS